MSAILSAVIVDDESKARSNLQTLLEDYCPEISVVQDFEKPAEALSFLLKNNIDLAFIDINMPGMSGLELLNSLNGRCRAVIVSAHDNFGIDAVKSGAFDYLLKPVAVNDLRSLIERLAKHERQTDAPSQDLAQPAQNDDYKLSVPHSHGFKIIDLRSVLYITSDNSYCIITFDDDRTFTVTRGIKEFEDKLEKQGFFRIHNKHLINMNFLETFTMVDGGMVTMSNGKEFPVSRRRLKDFKQLTKDQFNSLK